MTALLIMCRKVMLLVKAGSAVDDFIAKLVPLLEKGDIIIDGGNSEYQDSRSVSCIINIIANIQSSNINFKKKIIFLPQEGYFFTYLYFSPI